LWWAWPVAQPPVTDIRWRQAPSCLTGQGAALAATYGDRLERAVLFGSRARGDARPASDYDVAVFILEPGRWFDEVVRLAGLGTDILLETGAVISAKPFRAGSYSEPGPLMREIRREGVEL
jgi:predicted nucleotidyltransferase